jgi:hypothetical protein
MSYTTPLEEIVRTIREDHPEATEDQVRAAIDEIKDDFTRLIIDQLEKSIPCSIKEVVLPSDEKSRLQYRKDLDRASRSRSEFRIYKVEQANLRRRMVAEIESWKTYHAEMEEIQEAIDCADQISELQNASTIIENVMSKREINLTSKIKRSEKSEAGTMRRLKELSSNANEE